MQLPTPKQFAELLYNSLLPNEVKELILEKLDDLTNEQVIAIYETLLQEQDKIKTTKTEFESKLQFTELKFDQELAELKAEEKK